MKRLVIATACLTVAVLGSFAAGVYADTVSDRETAMKEIGKAYKAIAGMAKAGTFDQAEINKHATVIATKLEAFKTLFPDGSETGDKQASPTIWTDRAGFDAAQSAAHDAAVKIATTDATAFDATFKDLGAGCKACHTKYRLVD
jgi:cytochrome c556